MNALGDLAPYLVLIAAGFLPNEIWRMLGIVVAHGLDEGSELVVWVRAVATALLAGVIAKIILFPPGGLAACAAHGAALGHGGRLRRLRAGAPLGPGGRAGRRGGAGPGRVLVRRLIASLGGHILRCTIFGFRFSRQGQPWASGE